MEPRDPVGTRFVEGATRALKLARRPVHTVREFRKYRARHHRGPNELGPLGIASRPLVFRNHPIVVAWSPKCACTHVIAWFFGHQGLLKAAEYYDPWVHVFRSEVYYDSHAYREAARAVLSSDGAGHTLLRVTRDPERRMVSIFRHAVRSKNLWPLIEWRIGVNVGEDGLSLVEFDRFLARESVGPGGTSDIHFLAQAHESWDMDWDRVVTLNIDTHSLDAGLGEVDRGFGMDVGAKVHRLQRLAQARRYSKATAFDGDGAIETHKFKRIKGHDFPSDDLLASPLLAEMVRRHHAWDIGRVATADTAGLLFQDLAERDESRRSG